MKNRGTTTMRCVKRCWDHAVVGLDEERGVALIMTMLILVMLTFIGIATISTSSTELSLSANYRRSREAFHTAAGVMETALIDTSNFYVPQTVPDPNPCPSGIPFSSLTLPNGGTLQSTIPSGTMSASGCVTFLRTDEAPAGSGSSALMNGGFKANYFVIDTTGTGSLGASSQQELVMDKIVPGG